MGKEKIERTQRKNLQKDKTSITSMLKYKSKLNHYSKNCTEKKIESNLNYGFEHLKSCDCR